MQTLIVLIFLVILGSMASAMIYMLRDKDSTTRTIKSLTWRIGLSVGLFILLMVGAATGYIKPHGILPPQPVPAENTK